MPNRTGMYGIYPCVHSRLKHGIAVHFRLLYYSNLTFSSYQIDVVLYRPYSAYCIPLILACRLLACLLLLFSVPLHGWRPTVEAAALNVVVLHVPSRFQLFHHFPSR